MPTATVERAQYTNYWADDSTANPCIVKVVGRAHGDFYDVIEVPTGIERQVHLHTLGRFHRE